MSSHVQLTSYAVPLAFLVASPFLPFVSAHELASTICIYLLIKWFFDYRKCTAAYLECKLRGVSKDEGYINQYIEPVVALNEQSYNVVLYGLAIAVLLGNLIGKFQ